MDDIQKQIDSSIDKVTAFSYKKIGDTPTDVYQLTPKMYVDTQITSVYTAISSITAVVSSISSGLNANFTAGESLASGDAVYITDYSAVTPLFDTFADTQVISQTSLVSNFPISTGNNRLLLIPIATGTAQNVTNVTYNGVPLTSIFSNDNADSINKYSLYFQLNPPTGTTSIVVTTSGNTNIAIQPRAYFNMAQQGPETSTSIFATNGGTATATITPLTSRAMVNMMVTNRGSGTSFGTAYTNHKDVSFFPVADSNEVTPIQSVTGSRVADNSGFATQVWLYSWAAFSSVVTQRVYKTSAIQIQTSDDFVGFANGTVGTASTVSVSYGGIYTGVPSIATGGHYYLSNTSGVISSVVGTITRKVGLGLGDAGLNITNLW